MERTTADNFRMKMKEWMEAASKEPIKITKKSGDSYVLVSSDVFEKMQLDLARLESLAANLVAVIQGDLKLMTEKSIIDSIDQSKSRALASQKVSKAVG